MTYAPESIKKAQRYLHDKTGLPWVSLGIIGDEHHRGGYHCGSDRVVRGDYSVTESDRDRRGLSRAASALDVGDFGDLVGFSRWLVQQCEAGTADTLDIREVIYFDGRRVRRWDRLGERDSGDDSHKVHTHISWFRDSEHNDKPGVFRRYFEDRDDGHASVPSTDTRPAPGPSYDFPLPSGHYFGPKHGGNESVSGYYDRVFNGRRDSEWLQIWVDQLRKRGWDARRGGDYLAEHGSDGHYGSEHEELIRAFQEDQGLVVGGLLGPVTWRAAFENPVT